MSVELPPTIGVLVHWYKHTLAEVRGAPVLTFEGTLEEYGDPDKCEVCVAILIGMEYPSSEQLLSAAERVIGMLQAEAKRRGLEP